MVYRACRSAARSGRAESSVPTRSVIASQCSHWRGNPFPARRCRADGTSRTPSPTEHRRDKCAPCGGTHGSRPTECGAERADRVVRPCGRLSGAFHTGRRDGGIRRKAYNALYNYLLNLHSVFILSGKRCYYGAEDQTPVPEDRDGHPPSPLCHGGRGVHGSVRWATRPTRCSPVTASPS